MKHPAFTLVEMLLVLLILTTLASLGVQGYQGMQIAMERERFFRKFESNVYLAIESAMTTNDWTNINVGSDSLSITIPNHFSKSLVQKLPSDLSISSSNHIIYFKKATANYAPTAKIIFTDKHYKKRITYQFYFGSGRYEKTISQL